ncbi:unnamed protein product [Symbiodinium microadriaticum]|nr:unnamed protein product [Symbiodinium microadriaticum]
MMFSADFQKRIERQAPWINEEGYLFESPKMRKENIAAAQLNETRADERLWTEQGQDLCPSLADFEVSCLQMCSRIYPGGLFYCMPFRSDSEQASMDMVAEFLCQLLRLCYTINVRVVLHLKYNCFCQLQQYQCFKDTSKRLSLWKGIFTMSSFGSPKQSPTVLWGTDKLIIESTKFAMRSHRRLKGLVSFRRHPADDITGTFVYAATSLCKSAAVQWLVFWGRCLDDTMHWVCPEVVEVVLLRHRRSMDQLISLDMSRVLDRITQDLIEQDIDFRFLSTGNGETLFKSRRVDMKFQDSDFFVTRPIGGTPVAPCCGTYDDCNDKCRGKLGEIGIFECQMPLCWVQIDTICTLIGEHSSDDVRRGGSFAFVMSTARKSLESVFSGAAGSGTDKNDKKKKKKDRKKKDAKKRKKGKKCSSSSQSSTTSPEQPSTSASELHMEDAAGLFGLTKKHLARPADAVYLDDLSTRQLAYTVSLVSNSMVASDTFEIGGELVTCIECTGCIYGVETPPRRHGAALCLDWKFPGGKKAWTDQLENKLKQFREKKLPTPKVEPKEEDEGEGEATGDDVPRPNSSDFEDDDGEGDDDDELPNESGDDDSDLFKGRFAAAPKSTEQTLEEMLGSLPPKLAGLKESFDGKLLESLPKSLSESDFTNWFRVLVKEQLLKLEDFEALKPLNGTLSSQLEASKPYFSKMSLKVVMAAVQWLKNRLDALLELGEGSARDDLKTRIIEKIRYVDGCFWKNQTSEDADGSPDPESRCKHDSFETLYLPCEGARRGVLQVHKVHQEIEGYTMLFRAEEIWALGNRQLDGLGQDIAESWKINLKVHVIRKRSYKGSPNKVGAERLRLPFDGLTYPAAIFLSAYVLQSRGCKPEMQQAALKTLAVILGASLPGSLKVPLIPNTEDCLLYVQDGHVSLASWNAFLNFADLKTRWHQCKLFLKEKQSVDTGPRVAVVVWFLLRQPRNDQIQDRYTFGRIQRGSGFCCSSADATLKDVGLEDLCLGHYGRPKALGALKEEKLAAKQELRALSNILSHVGQNLDQIWGPCPLAPVNGDTEDKTAARRRQHEHCLRDRQLRKLQGGPLYSCYQYLAHHGASISLIRDELNDYAEWMVVPGEKIALGYADKDDVLMELFSRDILKENGLPCTTDASFNFAKVVEILGKVLKCLVLEPALMDELLFGLFSFARRVVLGIKFRRGPTFRCILSEALGMLLAVVHELEQHHLYLRTAPWKAACLIAPADDPETKARVLKELEAEWTMVVSLEAHPASAAELQQHCGFTLFQNYREVMTVCEKHGWKEHDEVASIMRSWFPEVAWSSNVESLFSEMSAAVKKSGQSDLGSVANLMSVGIRGLTRRICIQEDAPQSLKLDKDDWSGQQVSGLKSKIFTPSSSPACGSEQSMIRMQIVVVVVVGLVFPPFLSSFHFQAVRLKELPYVFTGGLPKEETDETRIPVNGTNQDELEDPLCDGESTKVLTLLIGRSLVSTLLVSAEEVKIFDYTIHVAEQTLEAKCGSNLLLRRGAREFSLLGWLVEKGGILKARVSSLMDLMDSMGIGMAKNSTKAQRIRKILALSSVRQECSQASIDRILKDLEHQEAKRKAKDDKQAVPEPARDEEEIIWEELEDDPAARACRELLQGQDEEEEVGDEPAGQEALPGGQAGEASRASRAMLSASTSLPEDLLRLMPLPAGTSMNKVVHSDRTLPHFQGKLHSGALVDGKTPVCT